MKHIVINFVCLLFFYSCITTKIKAQLICDSLVSYGGKIIEVRKFEASKKEVSYIPCSQLTDNQVYVPKNQVKGLIKDGKIIAIDDFVKIYDRNNIVIREDTVNIPVKRLSIGKILIGMSTNTPNIGLGINTFSSMQNNNAGIQFADISQVSEDVMAFNFSSCIGYSPIQHVLFGLSGSYDILKVGDERFNTLWLSPFIRAYVPFKDNILPFSEFSWNFTTVRDTESDGGTEANGFTGKLGVALFLNQVVSFDVFGIYQNLWSTPITGINYTYSQFGIGAGFNLFIK